MFSLRHGLVIGVAVLLGVSPLRADDYVVFLLGGQSNMVGRGLKNQLPGSLQGAQSDVRLWYAGDSSAALNLPKNQWVSLAPGSGKELGPEVTFGRRMADAFPEHKIALVKYAVDGTSLYSGWNPNSVGPQYQAFLNTVNAALANLTQQGHTYRVAGMLWLQGEEDSKYDYMANAYASNLADLIADVRFRFGEPKLPFLVGRVHPSTRPYVNVVRAAQAQVADADAYADWVNLDDAPINGSDPIHFNTTGYMRIGEWYADAWLPHADIGDYNANPKLSTGTVTGVSSSWHTVTLQQNYSNMVVVATPAYNASLPPAVVRVRNASGSSFDIRVQNPSDAAVSGYTVHYMVVEAGRYKSPRMEAGRLTSTVTDHAGDFDGQPLTLRNRYERPVVLGQVMSHNDSDWSVFWARGSGGAGDFPDDVIYVGKHVGQDSDATRANETLGWIVLEAGNGTINGVAYHAGVSGDSVQGVHNSPPYSVGLSGLNAAKVAIASPAGLDAHDGGWPILYGNSPLSTSSLKLAIDEDQHVDQERLHTTERVAYVVFASGSNGAAQPPDEEPTDGTIVFEAEDYDHVTFGAGSTAGHTWVHVTDPAGYSGTGAMRILPDNDINLGNSTAGPRIDYNVDFPAAGTYYVWVRAQADDSADNSVHAGLLAEGPATLDIPNALRLLVGPDWAWFNGDAARVTIDVPSPGTHTFSLWMREDGCRFDRILLTTDSSLNPNVDESGGGGDTGGGGDEEPPPPPMSGGGLRFEAEDYIARAPGVGSLSGHQWTLDTSVPGFSGNGAMWAGPNAGANAGGSDNGPRLDYSVNLPAAGTWYIWLRCYAEGGNEDSVHAGLFSKGPATQSDGLTGWKTNWYWWKTVAGGRAKFTATSAGVQTFSIWMREDGVRVDEIFLTQDPDAKPE